METVTFASPYQTCGDHPCETFNGKPATILAEITEPTPEIDAECLPMYTVVCAGIVFTAWPEEIGR